MQIKYLPQDHEQRLHGGVCLYKGKPYILSVFNAKFVQLNPLHEASELTTLTVEVTDKDLDISSPNLGYINFGENALYLMRKPERRYKQTVVSQSLLVYTPLRADGYGGWNTASLLYSKSTEDMFLNRYPTLPEVLREIRKQKVGRAISRDVALVRDSYDAIHVFYKADDVGTLDLDTNTVRIPSGNVAWVISHHLEGFDWRIE